MKPLMITSSIVLVALVAGLVFAQADVEPTQTVEPTQAVEPTPVHAAPLTQQVTLSDCSDAWYKSQAKAWCTTQNTEVTSDNKCFLERTCGATSDWDGMQVTFTGTPSQVSQLCWILPNLQVGGC
ncbi:MAG: hypothetical protein OXH70_21825 [Acidobacteria bacterium]|nr:hypothetical protein [Acidobacteriota bacterium]